MFSDGYVRTEPFDEGSTSRSPALLSESLLGQSTIRSMQVIKRQTERASYSNMKLLKEMQFELDSAEMG